MNTPKIVRGILFSRDRAMQLEAALRSLELRCVDFEALYLTVIYHASDENFAHQYRQLEDEYRSHRKVRFARQSSFWFDTLAALSSGSLGSSWQHMYKPLLSFGWRFSWLRRRLLRPNPAAHILFLVDDNLFVRNFSLMAAVEALSNCPQALGFSLRLGWNTTDCYSMNRPQRIPNFSVVGPDILSYEWIDAELDFGYPLEVSSSLYRTSDLLPLLDGCAFSNPNQLESRLAERSHRFYDRPRLLCFDRSVTFSNPVNLVNQVYRNRSGERGEYSSQKLAEEFAAGYRIDVDSYFGFSPNSCHQEVELRLMSVRKEINHD